MEKINYLKTNIENDVENVYIDGKSFPFLPTNYKQMSQEERTLWARSKTIDNELSEEQKPIEFDPEGYAIAWLRWS